jgi:hypothetical protein
VGGQLIETGSKHPPGTVGYFTAWHPRYFQFYDCLTPLRVPMGTTLMRIQGSSSVAGINGLVERMEGEWLWILPDDHTFAPDTLMNLLDRQVDVVAPIVCMRAPPFECVGFKTIDFDNGCVRYTWEEVANAHGELLSCQALGGGGLLIRKEVPFRIEKPWFSAVIPDGLSEDIDFTNRLFLQGTKLWLDTAIGITHIVEAALQPMIGPDGKFGMSANILNRRYWLNL